MRILTLMPEGYSLLKTLLQSFEKLNHEVVNLNYLCFFEPYQNQLITKTVGLPRTIKNKIKKLLQKLLKSENVCFNFYTS